MARWRSSDLNGFSQMLIRFVRSIRVALYVCQPRQELP